MFINSNDQNQLDTENDLALDTFINSDEVKSSLLGISKKKFKNNNINLSMYLV